MVRANPRPVEIVFDGGSRGNPGEGYGSYLVKLPDGREVRGEAFFGEQVTNNEAEYRALIEALRVAIREAGDPRQYWVVIRGDSALVIRQVAGDWGVQAEHLRALRREVLGLLGRFAGASLSWWPRRFIVRALGH